MLSIEDNDDKIVVALLGRTTLDDLPNKEEIQLAMTATDKQVLIDASSAESIDTATLQTLIAIAKRHSKISFRNSRFLYDSITRWGMPPELLKIA